MKTGRVASLVMGLGLVAGVMVFIETRVPAPEETPQMLPVVKNKVDTAQPNFGSITDVSARKVAFFDFLRPDVDAVNAEISKQRAFLLSIKSLVENDKSLSTPETERLSQIATSYDYELRALSSATVEELLARVDVLPTPLVLVQAANESGWGNSRFAKEGRNYFGQWCFKKGCGLIPAERDGGMTHEVAKFGTVRESIASYMNNLNTNAAYAELRGVRKLLRDAGVEVTAKDLIPELTRYSERKDAYVAELMEMLDQNQEYL